MASQDRFEPLAVAAPVIGLAIAAAFGVTETFGAHPVWALQTAIIGTASGAILCGMLRMVGFHRGLLALGGAVALTAPALALHFGKQLFVSSCAENAVAGRIWHFGRLAVAASATIFLCALIVHLFRR